ncbi:MAG: protein phosphatase 2C domain-containing protein [Planctomycetota bacterium]|jgi:serine/threonine protein phosphatase PrpC
MIATVTRVVAAGKHGQDRAEVVPCDQGVVVIVADGAGGTSGGGEAADSIVMWTKAMVSRTADLIDTEVWRCLLIDVDHQLDSIASGQTTAVVAIVTDEAIVGASVGDSSAWLIGPDRPRDLTTQQARKPLIGSGQARPSPFTGGPLDGTLLVATDGLINYAPRDGICAAAQNADLRTAAEMLVNLPRLESGALPDDIGLVLCRRTP